MVSEEICPDPATFVHQGYRSTLREIRLTLQGHVSIQGRPPFLVYPGPQESWTSSKEVASELSIAVCFLAALQVSSFLPPQTKNLDCGRE